MAYVRPKKINGKTYYYLVETKGKTQQVKKYLGKTIPPSFMQLFQKRKKGYF